MTKQVEAKYRLINFPLMLNVMVILVIGIIGSMLINKMIDAHISCCCDANSLTEYKHCYPECECIKNCNCSMTQVIA